MEHPIIIDSRGKAQKDSRGIIGKYIGTVAGRLALANAMIQPLRTGLDYSGIARKCFTVTPMPPGAIPTYTVQETVPEKGFTHKSVVISARGRAWNRHDHIKGQRVIMPTFEIFSNPTIRISDVKARRFDIIDRKTKI